MYLIEYLKTRGRDVLSLTYSEAKILNIPYPLKQGWIRKYGGMKIDYDIVGKLIVAREKRFSSRRYLKIKEKFEKRQG